METDWSALRSETVDRLRDILRFDTTNPPGNELPLAQYLEGVLAGAGIETELLIPAPDRAALIGTIRGTGEREPVILLAHMDVVGVEREKWSCDPFAAELHDGFIYGRGAIDDKGMLTANLIVMLALQRHLSGTGTRLTRDVVFVATSDEEAGGEWGMGWLLLNRPDVARAEFALNEGGRTRMIAGGRTYLAIQTGEKISHVITVTASGPAGHAAIPLEGNAIYRLVRALARLREHVEPLTLTPTTRKFFGDLARIWPDPTERDAMMALASEQADDRERGGMILSKTPVFNAVLRNGISATSIAGGVRHNVIPATASAGFNVRTLPGVPIEEVVERIRRAIDDDGVTIEISQLGVEAPSSDPESEMFRALSAAVTALRPDITVVPYLSTGVTDSARLRTAGVQAYGILPFPMTQADEERMHGHDERVAIESLHFGTRLIYESVIRVASPDPL